MDEPADEIRDCARQAIATAELFRGAKVTNSAVLHLKRFMTVCKVHDDYMVSAGGVYEGEPLPPKRGRIYEKHILSTALKQIANWDEGW